MQRLSCLLLGTLKSGFVILKEVLKTMTDPNNTPSDDAVAKVIALAEMTLAACDEQGFVFAAIDISSALDKLRKIRDDKLTQ